jgi:hypothetical protein
MRLRGIACRDMTTPTRLVTYVSVAPGSSNQVSAKARHELELADGRRILLLDDRGWGSTGAWADSSAADLERTARTVVGPDEPFDDLTAQDVERLHWQALSQVAQEQGVRVHAEDLLRLPHVVVLSEAILQLVQGPAPGLAPRPLGLAYLHQLLVAVADRVCEEQSDALGAAWLEASETDLVVVIQAGGRRLAHPVKETVYHYEPDGNDPSRHASWLAQLFDEEARS